MIDALPGKHVRAICEEIGERLGFMLNRTAQEPPRQLIALLRRFKQLEQTRAPSIAPSLEELAISVFQTKERTATAALSNSARPD